MAFTKQFKKTVTKSTKDILTNKYVLYLATFFAFGSVLTYLGSGNYIGLALFCLIGYLTSYFTKNMVIILLVAMIASSFIHISRKTVEGMSNKKKKKNKNKKNVKEGVAAMSDDDDVGGDKPAEISDEENSNNSTSGKPRSSNSSTINHQKTTEETYKNLHKILGSENFKAMTSDTKELLKRQNELTESLKNMTPLIESAQGMLEGFDMKQLNKMMGSFDIESFTKKMKQ